MVVLVQSGVEHDDGNLVLDEGPVIAVGLELPGEVEPNRLVVVAAEEAAEAVAGARAVDFEAAVLHAADHVDVDAELDRAGGNGRRPEPALRAEHAHLFAVPKREQDRAARVELRVGERLDGFQQRGDAAGVVVRAVEDVADRAVGVAHAAVADVVVMGADDDGLVLEHRVGAREQREDVASAAIAGLEDTRRRCRRA